jgi:hypothetical protein
MIVVEEYVIDVKKSARYRQKTESIPDGQKV